MLQVEYVPSKSKEGQAEIETHTHLKDVLHIAGVTCKGTGRDRETHTP